MLTTQLRELEENGLIHREVYAVVPPKTEYSLTEKGKKMIGLIKQIRNYGLELIEEEKRNKEIDIKQIFSTFAKK